MKIQKVEINHFEDDKDFYDISTGTGNFVVSNNTNGYVVHNSHIACLMVVALLKLIPELFHHHKIYRAVMPLYGVKKWQGKFLPFYTEEDMLKFKNDNPKVQITRYKGLGEMNPEDLASCMLDPSVRKLQEISDWVDGEPDEIFKMMSDAETKRGMMEESDD